MKAAFLLLLALAPGASSMPDRAGRERLMDEIEQKLRLPEGAFRFDEYARYYATKAAG